MVAYYNEIDPAAAHILRALIDENVIAPGIVDTRSIKDVQPNDLIGFTQCHFFAGGGLWSVAARLAGWPDNEPLWTGSCPCQPFSAAGKGTGTDDPRHLWPDFYRLIRARRPAVVMGEQVAGAAGYGWFDGVRSDLEGERYASRSVDFPACSVDAPHQRNRQYWVAMADDEGGECGSGLREDGEKQNGNVSPDSDRACPACAGRGRLGPFFPGGISTICGNCNVVDAAGIRRCEGQPQPEIFGGRTAAPGADASGVTLGDAFGEGLEGQSWHGDKLGRSEPYRSITAADGAGTSIDVARDHGFQRREQHELSGDRGARTREEHRGGDGRNGTHWSDAEWIICHDGKARRAKPGLRLLAHGVPGRVDLWRVGGNAIVPEAAAEVIASFIDVYGLPSDWRAAA
ncbi:DNA (cytosine-5)-methyltransferase 1 [Ensifer sp. KUDG1]|uniref:DNA cytosine methyltransferase n=1 Tax=Ensifer sp. KUDG1 TaxID=3373919 RepID=UPI003D1FD396